MKIRKVIILIIFVCITLITMGNTKSVNFQVTELTNTITPSPTTTNMVEPATPIAVSVTSQKTNDGIGEMIAGGIIGIVGAIIGSLVNHWLTIQRDKINRKEQEKDEIRKKITQGADELIKKHNLARVPFHGGDSLYFPNTNISDPSGEIQSELNKLSDDLEIAKEILEKTTQSINEIKNRGKKDNE